MPRLNSKRERELEIDVLGPAKIPTPIDRDDKEVTFVGDDERILISPYADDAIHRCADNAVPPSFEKAGPRKKIYFDPAKAKAAVVTCGGLCPGINSVIRAIVLELYHNYGVENIVGIRCGLQGFIPEYGHPTVELTPGVVANIHGRGGSFLGMSRGPQDVGEIVDALERMNISLLFMIGGDGTIRASQKIQREVAKRNLKIAIVGVPKTIDNDISFVSRTFGFDSAVAAATEAIRSAHNEATSVPNGIGLVKVMGRYAGFVAATTALALADVNFCLIPEVPFELDGPQGLLAKLEQRLLERRHAVILVAEGAGQHLFEAKEIKKDPSGNILLNDIGPFLKRKIGEYFTGRDKEVTIKYIDPSYMIRSVPASPADRVYCSFLGQHAVHAAMAGKTGLIISRWNFMYVHVPFAMCTARHKFVDPKGGLWRSVLEMTGQGALVSQKK